VRERPIIFTGGNPDAILAGRKTMTRRVLKCCVLPDLLRYQVGDRLWVKEPHWRYGCWFKPGAGTKSGKPAWQFGGFLNVTFDAAPFDAVVPKSRAAIGWHKRSPLFMPKWASRITLTVTGVKVERLQDISEADAQAEGLQVFQLQDASDPSAWYESAPGVHQSRGAVSSFIALWKSIHGPDSWADNPWVAAYTFELEAKP